MEKEKLRFCLEFCLEESTKGIVRALNKKDLDLAFMFLYKIEGILDFACVTDIMDSKERRFILNSSLAILESGDFKGGN